MEATRKFANIEAVTNIGGKLSYTVGVLLITHSGIGWELMQAAKATFGMLPLPIIHLAVNDEDEPETLIVEAKKLIDGIHQANGILILTDMFGATPFNIARSLNNLGDYKIKVVSGLNLPMLIRILNYPELPLEKLALKAVSGGREGVIEAGVLN